MLKKLIPSINISIVKKKYMVCNIVNMDETLVWFDIDEDFL